MIAVEKGPTVHLFESGEMVHIHCFISVPPKMSVTEIVVILPAEAGEKGTLKQRIKYA